MDTIPTIVPSMCIYLYIKEKEKPTTFYILASQIIARINLELIAILCVIPDTSAYCVRVRPITFKTTINGANRSPKALAGNNEIMAIIHPIPQGSPERYDSTRRHNFWVVQTIKSYAIACWAVVEVPRQLYRSPPVVALVGRAWVLCVGLVAIVFRWAVDLLNVAHMSSLMRDMRKERCNLTPRII